MGAFKNWAMDIADQLTSYALKYDDELVCEMEERHPDSDAWEIAQECCYEWNLNNWEHNAWEYLFQTVCYYPEELYQMLCTRAEELDEVIFTTDDDSERYEFTEEHKHLSSIIAEMDIHNDYSDVVVETSSLNVGDVVAVRDCAGDYVFCKVMGVDDNYRWCSKTLPYTDQFKKGNPNNYITREYVVLVSRAA